MPAHKRGGDIPGGLLAPHNTPLFIFPLSGETQGIKVGSSSYPGNRFPAGLYGYEDSSASPAPIFITIILIKSQIFP
jgi:hypothetical protein